MDLLWQILSSGFRVRCQTFSQIQRMCCCLVYPVSNRLNSQPVTLHRDTKPSTYPLQLEIRLMFQSSPPQSLRYSSWKPDHPWTRRLHHCAFLISLLYRVPLLCYLFPFFTVLWHLQDQGYLVNTQDHYELHPAVLFRVREAYLFYLYCIVPPFLLLFYDNRSPANLSKPLWSLGFWLSSEDRISSYCSFLCNPILLTITTSPASRTYTLTTRLSLYSFLGSLLPLLPPLDYVRLLFPRTSRKQRFSCVHVCLFWPRYECSLIQFSSVRPLVPEV